MSMALSLLTCLPSPPPPNQGGDIKVGKGSKEILSAAFAYLHPRDLESLNKQSKCDSLLTLYLI